MLILATIFCLSAFVGSVLANMADDFRYDNRPAVTMRTAALVSGRLAVGEPIQFVVTGYDKRADCVPPRGSGEAKYRIWFMKGGVLSSWVWLDYESESKGPPGRNLAYTSAKIPMPALAPGEYGFQWRLSYRCEKARSLQTIDGPVMPFTII